MLAYFGDFWRLFEYATRLRDGVGFFLSMMEVTGRNNRSQVAITGHRSQ